MYILHFRSIFSLARLTVRLPKQVVTPAQLRILSNVFIGRENVLSGTVTQNRKLKCFIFINFVNDTLGFFQGEVQSLLSRGEPDRKCASFAFFQLLHTMETFSACTETDQSSALWFSTNHGIFPTLICEEYFTTFKDFIFFLEHRSTKTAILKPIPSTSPLRYRTPEYSLQIYAGSFLGQLPSYLYIQLSG